MLKFFAGQRVTLNKEKALAYAKRKGYDFSVFEHLPCFGWEVTADSSADDAMTWVTHEEVAKPTFTTDGVNSLPTECLE